ncbi:MerR family transcriptional regulator [Ornithinimicrobium flavum]|uniref:helix-turn-helix domain-containing protein n=1 Tax=Ornithinimicrobium flavum TaxID=1288636 RepID=UPI00106F9910|nr:MerR family transcriptional regulator [Ornithinimicrobium flavum]
MSGIDGHDGLVHIGEVAERTGLSHRTIRYYEEMGLVSPVRRTEGGFRLYDDAGIARLQLITPMKPLGYSIGQIGELLRALDTVRAAGDDAGAREAALAALEAAHAEAERRIAHLRSALVRAEAFAERLQQEVPRAGVGA